MSVSPGDGWRKEVLELWEHETSLRQMPTKEEKPSGLGETISVKAHPDGGGEEKGRGREVRPRSGVPF